MRSDKVVALKADANLKDFSLRSNPMTLKTLDHRSSRYHHRQFLDVFLSLSLYCVHYEFYWADISQGRALSHYSILIIF
jgi:hypothetical protein